MGENNKMTNLFNSQGFKRALIFVLLMVAISSRFINIGADGVKIDETWVVPTTNFHFEDDSIYPKLFNYPQFKGLGQQKQKIIRTIYNLHPLFQVASIHATDVHPPLFFFLNYYWGKSFGYDMSVVRIPAALYCVVTLFLLLMILKKQEFGYPCNIVVVSLLVISPFYLFLSNFARPYTLLLLLCLLSSFLAYLLVIRDFNNRKLMAIYIVSATATVYTHYFGILVVASQAVYLIYESYLNGTLKRHFLKLCFIELIIAFLFMPWFIVLLMQIKIKFPELEAKEAFKYFNMKAVLDLILFYGPGYSRSTVFSASNIITSFIQFLLFLYGSYLMWIRRGDSSARFWLFFFWFPLLLIVIANNINPVFSVRNSSIIFIPYLTLCGFGLFHLKRWVPLTVLCFVLLYPLGLFYVFHGLSYENIKGEGAVEDWKAATNYILTIENNPMIYVYHSSFLDAVYYHIPDPERVLGLPDEQTTSGPPDQEFVLVLMNHGGIPIEEKVKNDVPFLLGEDYDTELLNTCAKIYIYKVKKRALNGDVLSSLGGASSPITGFSISK